ncbi:MULTISPECIES: AzlC family ABC transporter permease [Halomonas]|uniref:AzlC family ABC transporter permease n=1 Tax=Halomonas TaxID=2745 RepID=UPI001C93BA37|nr:MULTISPECIES: AzlC family ABC transporter permease [Halomonas]MBY6207819.1 AzlC family ABC transporter permease [Halomonas sp. DP3Y7-2]MBY6228628.1 AzlC family ABC transporter permease [Halomonas sp. DP3Y7-1]MCA0916694.1 AzlC family ABC transporter permease [Halomonas denitrificans]
MSSYRQPFLRSLAPAVAIIPVSMLFGVIAYRADWSMLEVFAASFLGFTGSGQFAVLPLAESNASFVTMLIICASINSRYFPIAFTTTNRLPKRPFLRAFVSHMLGDEAYATERSTDSIKETLIIRLTIFVFWVSSGVIGAIIGKAIPNAWLSADIHLGFPASVVLVYLSVSQIRMRAYGIYSMQLVMVATCMLLAGTCYWWLGPTYFWVPSVIMTAVILNKWKKHE